MCDTVTSKTYSNLLHIDSKFVDIVNRKPQIQVQAMGILTRYNSIYSGIPMLQAVVSINRGEPAECERRFIFELVEAGRTLVQQPPVQLILFKLMLEQTVNTVNDFQVDIKHI